MQVHEHGHAAGIEKRHLGHVDGHLAQPWIGREERITTLTPLWLGSDVDIAEHAQDGWRVGCGVGHSAVLSFGFQQQLVGGHDLIETGQVEQLLHLIGHVAKQHRQAHLAA
jgi:hypothetical protein